MKKLTCIILTLMILMTAFSACAAANMDAVFDYGNPTLMEIPEDFDFTILEGDVSLLTESNEKPCLWSMAPCGYSGIFTVGKSMAAVYDQKVSAVHPSAERGVKDEYGNLEQYFTTLTTKLGNLVGEEGVVYSPDGRYAFIGNKDLALMYMKLFVDPILLDVSTGELILTATYPDKIGTDGIGAVTSGLFSADGRSFFYIVYGGFKEGRVRLCRYDLETGETETCFESDRYLDYPRLSELSDGSLLMLNDTIRKDEPQGLVIASQGSDGWSLREEKLPLDSTCCYAHGLIYSSGSGLACLTERKEMKETLAFQIISPEKDFEGLDRLLCVTKDTNEIVSLSPEEYMKATEGEHPYQEILKAVFSPDGHYLLLHTQGDSRNLLLVRLEDMKALKVSGLDPEEINSGARAKSYPVCIEWNTEALIIGTKDGIRAFTFVE